jgi:type I restriction enzyme, S subunit
MKHWITKPLAEVATVIRGVSFDKSQVTATPSKNLLPILRAGNIQSSLLTDSDLVYVPDKLVSEVQRMRLGDLAICMSSGSPTIVGKTAHLVTNWHGSVGAFCAIIRFNANLFHRFGSYWFRSPAFLKWRDSNAKGANIQNLRRAELEMLSIPVPPLAEQKRIVELLDQADGLRKLRAEADRHAADLIPALFHETFGDPTHNPKGFATPKFVDVSDKIFKGAFDLKQAEYRKTEGIPFVRISNVQLGSLDLTDAVYISHETAERYKKCQLSPEDLVFCKVGTIDRIGKVPAKVPICVISQNNVGVKLRRKLVDPDYALAYLTTEYALSKIRAGSKKAVQDKLVLSELRNLPFLLPPLALQKQFAQQVTEIHKLGAQQASSRQRLDDLFQSMLHGAFNGEL